MQAVAAYTLCRKIYMIVLLAGDKYGCNGTV